MAEVLCLFIGTYIFYYTNNNITFFILYAFGLFCRLKLLTKHQSEFLF